MHRLYFYGLYYLEFCNVSKRFIKIMFMYFSICKSIISPCKKYAESVRGCT